jgi:hypothetical protein
LVTNSTANVTLTNCIRSDFLAAQACFDTTDYLIYIVLATSLDRRLHDRIKQRHKEKADCPGRNNRLIFAKNNL